MLALAGRPIVKSNVSISVDTAFDAHHSDTKRRPAFRHNQLQAAKASPMATNPATALSVIKFGCGLSHQVYDSEAAVRDRPVMAELRRHIKHYNWSFSAAGL